MRTAYHRRHIWSANFSFPIVFTILPFILLCIPSFALNTDGVLLLSLRYSVVDDPIAVLENWNYDDITPCSWHGVTCDDSSHVTALSLPSSSLLGSIPSDLVTLPALQRLDLSNNSINGSLPVSLFNSTELRFLDLSNNLISGEFPVSFGGLQNLQVLNLSDNALAGKLPESIASLGNLTVVSLKNNYFSGEIPRGFRAAEFLDLSSNLFNGSLPSDFEGNRLRYLNVSYNRISGEIPAGFADEIPEEASVDFSFNDLSGQIPNFRVLDNQAFKSFLGNPGLCGSDPAKNPCHKPFYPPPPPLPTTTNISSPSSPPALAAIPKTIGSNPLTDYPNGTESGSNPKPGLKPGIIVGIIVGDIAGLAILGIVIFYCYQSKKKKIVADTLKREEANAVKDTWSTSSYSSESKGFARWSCLCKTVNVGGDEESETTGSESDEENRVGRDQRRGEADHDKKGTLVNFDSEKVLELETLLKASAYILGATGSSIMYKAVLQDGTALAVRRIGESGLDRFKEFEAQVRGIAKLVHPNLIRIRGFYWGTDEKLIVYDFAPNGSLANARFKKVGSSPRQLPWEARLRIARGVAYGLTYIHEKKHVHGNLKPSNILLGFDMEPKISDFGLERVLVGDTSYRTGGSARIFGSKRSTASHDFGPSPSPSPSSVAQSAPYNAPESLRTLKPNPKWDVYSFGVILLELLTGKIITVDDVGQANGLVIDDKDRAMRMVDAAIRAELEGKEEAVLACFRMGLACASPLPQRRPTMRETLQVLERFPVSSPSSCLNIFGR